MRPTDVVKIAQGMLDWLDTSKPTTAGWSINQVLEIIGYLLNPARGVRGPIFVDKTDIRRAFPGIPHTIVTQILDEVLSHPPSGANRNFSGHRASPVFVPSQHAIPACNCELYIPNLEYSHLLLDMILPRFSGHPIKPFYIMPLGVPQTFRVTDTPVANAGDVDCNRLRCNRTPVPWPYRV